MGSDGWLDAGVWFMSEVNYVLDRLYSEVGEKQYQKQRTLLSTNTIKAMESTIRPERYNQW